MQLAGTAAIIQVSEHQRGVSEWELASLFELYGTTTGMPDSMHADRLTLYLAKRLTEDHGGILQCQSKGLGTGSMFELQVPLVKGLRRSRTNRPAPDQSARLAPLRQIPGTGNHATVPASACVAASMHAHSAAP